MIRILALALACLCSVPSYATVVLVNGSITHFDLYEAGTGEFAVGQAFSLAYDFSPAATDFNPDVRRGEYRTAINSASLSIGGYALGSQGGGIVVDDGPFGALYDRYLLGITDWNGNLVGPNVAGLFPYAIEVQLDDPTGNALASDALPAGAPDLALFSDDTFYLAFASSITPEVAFGVKRVYGHVTSVSVIPEPPSIALVSLAALFFLVFGRPHHRLPSIRNGPTVAPRP